MSALEPEIRVAAPEGRGDVDAAATILLRSFAGQENANLGGGYARAVLRAYACDSSRFLVVARAGAGVVGFIAGEPGELVTARYRSLRGPAAKALLLRPWLIFDPAIRRMAAARLTKDPAASIAPGAWFLALVGVEPEFHRHGIGRMLLRAFEDEGRTRGFTEAALFVNARNGGARALYERSGWIEDGFATPERLRYRRSLPGA